LWPESKIKKQNVNKIPPDSRWDSCTLQGLEAFLRKGSNTCMILPGKPLDNICGSLKSNLLQNRARGYMEQRLGISYFIRFSKNLKLIITLHTHIYMWHVMYTGSEFCNFVCNQRHNLLGIRISKTSQIVHIIQYYCRVLVPVAA
jgi:hypothetical protein